VPLFSRPAAAQGPGDPKTISLTLTSILHMRLRPIFRCKSVEQDEMRHHLEREIEQHPSGLNREPAPGHAPRDCRTGTTKTGMPRHAGFLQDARLAMRQLRKNPGFTCTAVFMLAVGMSAIMAIFAYLDASLIQPLPYRDPAGLVGVVEKIHMFPPNFRPV
jgi:hypothetical protein